MGRGGGGGVRNGGRDDLVAEDAGRTRRGRQFVRQKRLTLGVS